MADYRFTISLNTFDASLLPPGSPPKGSAQYSAAVHKFLQGQFAGFKGDARIVVSEDSILVEWTPPSTEQDPVVAAVSRLQRGELVPAIMMLELLRQQHPDELRILYNLGLAYSNLGRIARSQSPSWRRPCGSLQTMQIPWSPWASSIPRKAATRKRLKSWKRQ